MIGYLEGKLIHARNNYIIVNVGGVGYKVFAVPELLAKPIGSVISLYIYHKSTDDGQALFGLPTPEGLDFFEKLLTVSGVGPKIALTILSTGDADAQMDAISNGDATFFSQMAGVGKKTAERIIIELKDKVRQTSQSGPGVGSSDVFNALTGLGYSAFEARETLAGLNRSLSPEEQLKQALKLLSK